MEEDMEEKRQKGEENRKKKESRVVIKGVHPKMKQVTKQKMEQREEKKDPYTQD